MDIRNPLLEEIKLQYPHLLKLTAKSVKGLEDYLGIRLPESEIAYIAMHLGSVIEKKKIVPQRRYRIAVACPSGIGTSRLLATRIEKEYDSIQIVDVISTIHVEESWLKQEGIDFIISTIPIEIGNIPVITVSPLLSKEDRSRINKLLEDLRAKTSAAPPGRASNLSLKEKLIQLNSYSQGVIQVLDNFFLYTVAANDIGALINEVCSRLLENETLQKRLAEDLIRREEQGGTYIAAKEICLLHCRSSSVEELYFGALRLEEPIYMSVGNSFNEKMQLAVIMLAPEDCPQTHIEVISEVSKLIIEKPDFLQALRDNSWEVAHLAISNHLNDFYKYKSDDRRDLHE
jgi:mannitol operon transcriptional antiterminator